MGWFNTGWSNRKKITIDNTKVEADETGFPVLISRTDTDFSKARSDGFDFVFTKDDGVTEIPYEREVWVDGTGELIVWVKVDILASTDVDIYIYYNNPAQASDKADPENVWDDNYVMIQHLNETSGTHFDSTQYDNDGTNQGSTQDSDGKIDGANDFDGIDDYIDITKGAELKFDPSSSFTMEAWINFDSNPDSYGRIIDFFDSAVGGYSMHLWEGDVGLACFVEDDSNGSDVGVSTDSTVLSSGTLYHVVGTYNGTAWVLYLDGEDITSDTSSYTDGTTNTADEFRIGKRNTNDREFDGVIDEVRISDIVRSANWVKTGYTNMNSPSTFVSFDIEEFVEQFDVNALLKATSTETFLVDAILNRKDTFLVNAILITVIDKTFLVDAFLQATFDEDFIVDAILNNQTTFLVDSFLQATFTETFIVDTFIQQLADTETFTVDAFIGFPIVTVRQGTVIKDTGGEPASQTIDTGSGIEIKFIKLSSTRQTSEGFEGIDLTISEGFSDGINSRAISLMHEDGADPTNTASRYANKGLTFINSSKTTIAECDVSFGTGVDAGKFTLTWTTNDAVASIIHFVTYGDGSETFSANVGTFTSNIVTGNQSITGVGFRGSMSLFLTNNNSGVAPNTVDNGGMCIGHASASDERNTVTFFGRDGQAGNNQNNVSQRTDLALRTLTPSGMSEGNTDADYDFVSFDADGFTLNVIDAPASATQIFYAVLKGGLYEVGAFNQPTSNGTQEIITGSRPIHTCFRSWNEVASTSIKKKVASMKYTSSGADVSTEGGLWFESDTGSLPTVNDVNTYTDRVILLASGASTVDAEANYESTNDESFTLDWTVTDATAREILYWTVGEKAVIEKEFTVDAFLQAILTETFLVDTFSQASITETFLVDAFIQATLDETFLVDARLSALKEFTVDTFLQELDQEETFLIDTFLQGTLTETFTVDAFLQTTFTETFEVDALLQATFNEDFIVDAFLQATLDKTFEVDGFPQATFTETFLVDAFLQATLDKTFLVDAFIQTLDQELDFLVDGFIQAENQKMFILDALPRATLTETFLVDARLIVRNTETFLVDSILIVRTIKTFTVHGYLVTQDINKTFLVDGLPQATLDKTFLVDAFLQATFTEDFIVDGFPQATFTETFLVDAFLQATIDEDFLVDAFLQATFTETFTVDAITVGTKFPFIVDGFPQATFTEDFLVDAFVQQLNINKEFTVNSVIVGQNTESFIVDSLLEQEKTTTFTLDAFLQGQNQKMFIVDGELAGEVDKDFIVDGLLEVVNAETFDTDVILLQANTETFTVDSILVVRNDETFDIDALLQSTFDEDFTIDSILFQRIDETFLVDAQLVIANTEVFDVDTLLKLTQTENFIVDSTLFVINDEDFTVDAVLAVRKNFQVDAVLVRQIVTVVDAVLKATIDEDFLVDSILFVFPSAVIDIDALLVVVNSETFTIDAVLAEIKIKDYTVDALLKKEKTTVFALDAQLAEIKTTTFDVNAILISIQTETFDVDVILQDVFTETFEIDSQLIQLGIDETFEVNSILKEFDINKTFIVDGNVQLIATTEVFTVDAQLAKLAMQKNFIVDTFIQQLSDTETFTVDSILINVIPTTFTKDFTINSLLKAFNQDETFLIRAIVLKVPSNVIDVDAMLQATLTETVDVDSILVNVETETFDVDAILIPIATIDEDFFIDAFVQATLDKTFLVDGNVALPSAKTVLVDAMLKGTVDQLATIDSILTKVISETFLVDAVILGVAGINKPFTINALLQDTFIKDFQVDTFSQAVNTKDFLVDVLLTDGSQKFFLINAILKLFNEEDTFTVNANLRIITQLTPLVDAVLKATLDKTFLINSLLKSIQTEEFIVDAKLSTPVKFTIDAFLDGGSIDVPFFVDATLSAEFQKLFIVDAKLVRGVNFEVSAFIKALGDVRCQPSFLEKIFFDDLTDTSNWSDEINNTGVDGWGQQRIFIDGESVLSDGIIRATMRPGGFSPFQTSIFKTKYRRKAIASGGGIGVIVNGSKVTLEFEYKHIFGARGIPIGLNKTGAHPQNDPNTSSFHIQEGSGSGNIKLILDDGTTAVATSSIQTETNIKRFIVAESIGNTVTLNVYSDPEHTSHVVGSPVFVDSSIVNKNGLDLSWLIVGANPKLAGPSEPSTTVEIDEINIFASPCPVIELDALLKEFFGASFTVGAILKRQIQVDVDAVLRGRNDFTVDSILIIATKTQVDAVLSPKAMLVDFTINSLLKKQDEVTNDIDALLKVSDQEETFFIDSKLVVKSLETFFIDSQLIQNTVTVLPFVDALLKVLGVEGQTFVDSILVSRNVEEPLVNAILKEFNVEEEFTINAVLKALGLVETFIVDILISTAVQITPVVDAVLKLSGENGFCNFYPDTLTIGTGLEQFVGPIQPAHESNVDLLIGQEFTLNNQQVKRARILLRSTGGITVPSVISGKIWRNVVKGNVAGEVVQITSINTIDANASSGDLPTGVWTEVVFDFGGGTAPFLTGNFLIGIQHSVGSGINDPTGVGVAQPVISGGNVIAGEALFRREDNSVFATPDTWKVLISDAIDMIVDLEIVNGDDIVLGKGNQCPRVDSIVVDRFTEDSLVNAILVNRKVTTFTINVLLKTTDSEDVLINAILSPLKEFTIDSQLVVITISNDETFIVNARLQFVNQVETPLVDALLTDGFQKPFIVDTLLKKFGQASLTFTDAQIQALDQEEVFFIDSLLSLTSQPEVFVDGFLKIIDEEETFTITGALAITQPPVEFTIDAQINDEKERFRADALLQSTFDETFIIDTILTTGFQDPFLVDSIIKSFNTDEEFIVDSILTVGFQEPFLIDARLRAINSTTPFVDAVLSKDGLIFEFTVGSVIVRISPFTFNGLIEALGDGIEGNGNNGGTNEFAENPYVDQDDGGGFFMLPLGTLVGQRLRLPTAPVRITDYTFTMYRSSISGLPTGTITGKIYKNSIGGSPIVVGDLIATSDNVVNIIDLTTNTSGQLVTFTYTNPPEVTQDDNTFIGFEISGSNENTFIEVESTGTVIDGGDLNVEFTAGTWGADLGVDTKVTINIDIVPRQRGSALMGAVIGVRDTEFIVDGITKAGNVDETFTVDAKVVVKKSTTFTVGAMLIGSVDLLIGAFVGEVQETVLDVESVIRDTNGNLGNESTIGVGGT